MKLANGNSSNKAEEQMIPVFPVKKITNANIAIFHISAQVYLCFHW